MSKIVLDAGHSFNNNQSPNNKIYYEGNVMFKLATMIKQKFNHIPDIEVVLTRNDIKDNPTHSQRSNMAKNATLFISLHSNAGTAESITGSEIFIPIKYPEAKEFSELLLTKICEMMGHHSRGTKTRTQTDGKDYYGIIRNTVEIGCNNAFIVEHGFHTNIKDSNWLLNDSNIDKLAKMYFELIISYYFQDKVLSKHVSIYSVNDTVRIKPNSTYFNSPKVVPNFIINSNMKVVTVNGDRVVVSNENGVIIGAVHVNNLEFSSKPNSIKENIKRNEYSFGDEINVKPGSKYYNVNDVIPRFITNSKLFIREINGDRVVFSQSPQGAVIGAVNVKDISHYKIPEIVENVEKKLKKHDIIKIKEGSTYYESKKKVPMWVMKNKLYVVEVSDKRVIFSTVSGNGPITGVIHIDNIE
jgi:N-acetylmuramoyl-L-alanine amidase